MPGKLTQVLRQAADYRRKTRAGRFKSISLVLGVPILCVAAAGLARADGSANNTAAAADSNNQSAGATTMPSDTQPTANDESSSTSSSTAKSTSAHSADVHVQSQVTSDHSGDSSSVTINGQSVTVPANGSIHKTIQNDNGTSQVNISVQSDSSGSSSSSMNVSVTGNSSSTPDSDSE